MIQFRLDHLGEMLQFVENELGEKAASQTEIREVEVVDAIFDFEQWNETKAQLNRFKAAFPDQADKWTVWEGTEAQEVCQFY